MTALSCFLSVKISFASGSNRRGRHGRADLQVVQSQRGTVSNINHGKMLPPYQPATVNDTARMKEDHCASTR